MTTPAVNPQPPSPAVLIDRLTALELTHEGWCAWCNAAVARPEPEPHRQDCPWVAGRLFAETLQDLHGRGVFVAFCVHCGSLIPKALGQTHFCPKPAACRKDHRSQWRKEKNKRTCKYCNRARTKGRQPKPAMVLTVEEALQKLGYKAPEGTVAVAVYGSLTQPAAPGAKRSKAQPTEGADHVS